jgi:hypothetical protein
MFPLILVYFFFLLLVPLKLDKMGYAIPKLEFSVPEMSDIRNFR